MCSLEEAHEAYRYIGLPGYNPHVKKEVFFKYYNKMVRRHETILNLETSTPTDSLQPLQGNFDKSKENSNSKKNEEILNVPMLKDKDKILLINSRRVFHIAEEGRTYLEREELARSYFDQVFAVESSNPFRINDDGPRYEDHSLLLQIYIINKNSDTKRTNIYGFRPIKRHSYLFHRLIKNGFLCGKFEDLKKNIDWNYLPDLPIKKEEVEYICGPSYFKRKQRKHLSEQLIKKLDSTPNKYETDYEWVFWPDLD